MRTYLPCAGITLVRFNGYNLSLFRPAEGKTEKAPRESEKTSLAKELRKDTGKKLF